MASDECGRVLLLSFPSGLMSPFARLPIHSSIHPSIYPLSSWIQRASEKTQSRNCAQFFFLSFFLSFNPSIHPSNLEAYVHRPAYYLPHSILPFLSLPKTPVRLVPSSSRRTNKPSKSPTFSSPSLGEKKDRRGDPSFRCDRAARLPRQIDA